MRFEAHIQFCTPPRGGSELQTSVFARVTASQRLIAERIRQAGVWRWQCYAGLASPSFKLHEREVARAILGARGPALGREPCLRVENHEERREGQVRDVPVMR